MSDTTRESFNDRVGREVHVGDHIVYAVRRGSSMWLKEAVVQSIDVDEWTTYYGYLRQEWKIRVRVLGSSRQSILETPSRIVLVRTAKEIELSHKVRSVNLITFGQGAYDE